VRSRETVLGLVVLSLVLAGVVWVRVRPTPPPRAAAEPVVPLPAPAGRASNDEALPDVTVADGVVEVAGLRVTLSVAPRPPVAFQQHRFRVRVESASTSAAADRSGGAPLVLSGGRIFFEMKMPMGDHSYSLVRGEGGWQEAEVVLPFCPSGNRRWYATVDGTVAGRPLTVRFRLDLTRPVTAPLP
jgi:hypothetical protein